MCYDYKRMCSEIQQLTDKYKLLQLRCIGKSVMGKDIPCVIMGTGEKKLLVSGAYHGLEYLTAAFLVRFISELCERAVTGSDYMGYNVLSLLDKVTLYAVPMVNPDGVDIAVNGLDISDPHHRELISKVGIHSFHNVWQANANGVDINHNFDADWHMVVDKPSPTKYGGDAPETEPETRVVVDFVRKEGFDMLLAFHSQGKEIYYDFDGMVGERSLKMAKRMAEVSGYAVARPEGTASFGGCKDWFIQEFGREGFTVEIGSGKNPLKMNMLDEVYDENARIVLCTMQEM